MPRYDAVLVDVYETVLSVDHRQQLAAVAEVAGVPPADFAAAIRPWEPSISAGRATLAEAFEAVLVACGRPADAAAVARLVEVDRRILRELVDVPADTVPFLESARAAGLRTAFVSNCAEDTRPLLVDLGLAALVDELVLSCEVGSVKPEPEILRVALARLGVEPARAVLVDDQAAYCDGAVALGLGAVRIDRASGGGDVSSLVEVSALLRTDADLGS